MKLPVTTVSLTLGIVCGGCTATPETASSGPETSTATPPSAPPSPCKADALDSFIGQKATEETGAKILAASGARTLRWAGPGMAVTMDYRFDRVTVSYDQDMVIERASCG
ncbi:MAG: peptidase inhibitor I78 [Sphingomonadales bacterium]|nr:MAG: peptidase inhibitor I78 [Sphingomonadales bacterium]TNF04955.1 MAG: peptidase inhibitor I78 [Sphingomonadales bacterium]